MYARMHARTYDTPARRLHARTHLHKAVAKLIVAVRIRAWTSRYPYVMVARRNYKRCLLELGRQRSKQRGGQPPVLILPKIHSHHNCAHGN